ncbi:beta-N-acetylhexosaminidase [Teichococcus vastitatis]|uniref:beta-N-acetylhexosaminidase n=1 Tax=Teichococcus vastitatis TaxID=2307076 RepID=A0ABS9W2A4_9PROT|nr:beta-N-acetylhexosaminidase [Pseudoroseomonas vastitatis]MCI0753426.1 beta-N-acetylhexosaminidase [Pseudoroseomonas vastitatis]
MAHPRAAIIGLAGHHLSTDEVAMLRQWRPFGVILFARNIANPEQLRSLTTAIRTELGAEVPILVDQEGGRVARLRPPHWPEFPPAARFEAGAEAAACANATLLGLECRDLGLDVVCAPVLDLRLPGAHGIIGDRSFSADPDEVARLGGAWIRGLQEAGTIPVIKHIPGHGRAAVDSHLELPRVTATARELEADLAPFTALAASGAWAMTAHILYTAWDEQRPATLSPLVIEQVIRGAIGFDGPLVSDDLAMHALRGEPGGLARESLDAGCDLVLHCTGVLSESVAVLRGSGPLSDRAEGRLARARQHSLPGRVMVHDRTALARQRDDVLRNLA